MENLPAALGLCHRPLFLQQLVRGGSIGCGCLRDHQVGLLQCSISEQGISRISRRDAPRAARIVLASISDSDDAVENSSGVSAMIRTTFLLQKRCEFGQGFAVVGADPLLGAWDPAAALPMEWSEDHVWKCQIDLPLGQEYEYKFLLTSTKEEHVWQPGPNRVFTVEDGSPSLVVSEAWDDSPEPANAAAENVPELVEGILDDQGIGDVADAIEGTVDVVENALESAGINFEKMVEDALEEEEEEQGGTVDVKQEGGDAVLDELAEESESDQGSQDAEPSPIQEESPVVASIQDSEDIEENKPESSSEVLGEDQTPAEDNSESDRHEALSNQVDTTEVPEDSKGFKSFRFESQSAAMND